MAKFAASLRDELNALSVDVDVAQTRDTAADINHHLVYIDFLAKASASDTVMVTHVDDIASFRLLKQQLEDGATGICVSSHTLNRLIDMGLPAGRLGYALPGHDETLHPRPFVVGIASRVYSDGRKRERWLVELARRIRPNEFRFIIIGHGWEAMVVELRSLSFDVEYHEQFEAETYHRSMESLDYYLYLSTDEGSMGFIDALAAGVPTIATPQGFHLDAGEGPTYPFTTLDELSEIFERIALSRRRLAESVATWTWKNYARRHLDIWKAILSGLPIESGGPRVAPKERVSFAAELVRGSLQHSFVRWRAMAGRALRRKR